MMSVTHRERLQHAIQCHQQGQLIEAIGLYQHLADEISTPELYNNLASAQMAAGMHQDAATTLNQGRADYPDHLELKLTLALHHAVSGRYLDAIALAEEVCTQQPDRPEFVVNLANIYYQAQQLEQAEATYSKVILLDPNSSMAHFNLGTLLHRKGALVQAQHAFDTVLTITPDFYQASLHLGQILVTQGRYKDAVTQYQRVLAREPENPTVHNAIGMAFHVQGMVEQAQQHYHQALRITGDEEEGLVLLANSYRDLNDHTNAEHYYQRALQINPNNEIAQENLRALSTTKIAAWHLPMLADQIRNDAFQQAIQNQVKAGDHVLDIGTGSGLLAMMAAKAGAKQVMACEMIPELAEVATKVIKDNRLSNKITVVNQKSTQLSVGSALNQPANVLISEILDAGLLGEGVLPTFRHAKANLLTDDAILIPQGAQVHACLIQCESIKQLHPIIEISGFDLSAFNQFNPRQNCMTLTLTNTPHQKLTAPFLACEFDFRAPPPPASLTQPNRTEIVITATHSGELHGIAFWFNLQLDDEISLNSGPEAAPLHWGQTVYLFEQNRHVQQGESLRLAVLQSDTQLRFEVMDG